MLRPSRSTTPASLGELGRSEEAIEAYDTVDTRYHDDPNPALREIAALARGAIDELRSDDPSP